MKTYEIKIKSAAGCFHKMCQESYPSLDAAMVDVNEISVAFREHAIFVFCDGHIVCKTGVSSGEFREPFYKMTDGFHSFAIAACDHGDAHLARLAEAAARAIKEINEHLDSNYLWY